MITKQYPMKLGNELHISKLVSSNSSKNSILLKVNEQQPRLVQTENIDLVNIKAKQVSPRTVVSNTSQVLATDIVVDGVPYFYKWLKFSLPGYTIQYSEPVYAPSGLWMYSNSKNVIVTAVDENNIAQFSSEVELIPVFIDSRYLNLKDFITMDGRYYTPKRKGDSILCTFSKNILAFSADNSVFKAVSTDTTDIARIVLNEFVYSTPAKIDDRNAIVKYEYFPYQHTLIRSFREVTTPGIDGNVKLSNRNLDLSNIFIKKINDTVVNLTVAGLTSPMSGTICLATFMQQGVINPGDSIEVEYNYLFIDYESLVVDCRKMNADTQISTYVGPTTIATRGSTEIHDRSFGCVISQNNFIINQVFDFSSIEIHGTGSIYSYDYNTQNDITFTDGNVIENFYTANLDKVDSYLDGKKFKSCGIFKVVDSFPTYIDCGVPSELKDNFFDFEAYNIYPGSITILGLEDSAVLAGVGKIHNKYTYPITFNIDNETTSSLYLKVDTRLEEAMNIPLADVDIIDFCQNADAINKDFTYSKDNISACYVIDGNDVNITNTAFFDNDSKQLYIKIQKIPNAEIRIKYSDMHSNNGIVV